jgi:hypothetical protein
MSADRLSAPSIIFLVVKILVRVWMSRNGNTFKASTHCARHVLALWSKRRI